MWWRPGAGWFSLGLRDEFRITAAPGLVSMALGAAALVVVITVQPAEALPSFARQTGQTCGTCHTDYPSLTPFGRLFKLNGYTTGGGKYRTNIFPSPASPDSALSAYAEKIGGVHGRN